jgi:hypothetical protein
MPTTYNENHQIVISDDAARGGVTGHHVRYVLGLGLTGVTLAFAAIGIYFGYGNLESTFDKALAANPYELVRAFAPYAAVIVAGAALAALILGVWNAIWGRDEDASQMGMRLRVAVQFSLICVIMGVLYLSSYS